MRKAILALLMVTTAACTTTPPVENPPLPPAFEAQPAPEAPPPGEEAGYDLAAQRAKIAKIEMNPDTSFLSAEERQVVTLLIQAADLMNPIYLRSEERRVGKECCSTFRSRGTPHHK